MLIWGLVVGGVIGLAVGQGLGLFLGLAAGFLAALWLDHLVKTRVEDATKALRRQFEAELGRARAPAMPVAPTPPRPRPEPAAPTTSVPQAPSEVREIEPPALAPPPYAPPSTEPPGWYVAAREWLVGGNTIVRVGVVVLFVGLSFLVRYAAMAGLLPIELRLAAVGAVGLALLGVGFWRRTARPEFGLVLQGAGVAVIYLTLFGAARLFDVLPPTLAFGLMVLVCGLGCALALLQGSQTLAAVSFAGGFAVPVLLGGEGSSVGLFGYYAVLNLAVLTIALRRDWRGVKLIGFFATFGVATLWGVLAYKPADYATSQGFLALFVLIYLAAAVLQPKRAERGAAKAVDNILLFGPAIVGFGLQVGLVRGMPYGAAFSAIGFAAVYIAVAALVSRRSGDLARLMFDALIAIGVGFLTLAIPLGLGMRWTAAPWAIEGAAGFWVGMRQRRWPPRLFGLAMIGVAGLAYLVGVLFRGFGDGPLGPATLGAAIIAAAALTVAWLLRSPPPPSETPAGQRYASLEAPLGTPLFFYGFAFWCVAFTIEAYRSAPDATGRWISVVPGDLRSLLVMLLFAISAAAFAVFGERKAWPVATWPGRATLFVMALTLAGRATAGHHLPEFPGVLLWAATLALHLWLLWRWDRRAGGGEAFSTALHVGGVWLACAMLADSLWLAVDRAGLWATSWGAVIGLVAVTAVLLALTFWAGRAKVGGWPLTRYASAYSWLAAAPIAALVYLGVLVTAFASSGDTAPLPYVPVFNPVDLACGLALAALLAWRRMLAARPTPPHGSEILMEWPAMVAWSILALLVVNSAWLRVAHHYMDIAWTPQTLMDSAFVQTGLSILWTSLALALMLFATRRGYRAMWLTGAGLLGAVVVKLLLVDLSNTSGGARIVAFIVVGVLMLVVGYFAPLPPRRILKGGEQ